jgi:hypothetical protein
MNRAVWIAVAVTCALAGCGESGDSGPQPPPPVAMPQPSPDVIWAGRFVGTAKIGSDQRFVDALFTRDGAVRLYLGGPTGGAYGTLEQNKPADSAQFVGTYVTRDSNAARAAGALIGQGCGGNTGRFCAETPRGELQLSPLSTDLSADLRGELRVNRAQGPETWTVELHRWGEQYVNGVSVGLIAGQYREAIAVFALNGDTIVNIDSAGHLSFQSANSSCTGSGTVRVHLDGSYNAFDVALTIGNCKAPHADLNGSFAGLATITGGTKWDYDSLLRMWLSNSDPAQPAAVTTLAL